MSDREGHSSLPPSDDDLSLPKATVAKMITGSFLVVSRPSSGLKISATLTKPPPAVFYLYLFPLPPHAYSSYVYAWPLDVHQIRTQHTNIRTFHMHATQCTHARIHTRACCVINRTPSQRRQLRQGDSRLGHRMLRRSVPDPPHVLIFAKLI